jgi:signal transduction histidine kinase
VRQKAQGRQTLVDGCVLALAVTDAWLRAEHEQSALVVSLVAALALTLRRWRPLWAFALTLPALFSADILIAPSVALYTVAAGSRARRPVLLCAAVATLGYFVPWPPTHFHLDELSGNFVDFIDAAAYAGASVALGILVQTRRELSRHIAELAAGRERERQLEAESLLAQERARLSREMHDVVSHQVSLIAVQAGALRVTARDQDVRETADVIRRLSVRTLEELRQVVGVLRAAGGMAPQLEARSRLPDIARLVQAIGPHAQLQLDDIDGRRWPDSIEYAAFRTVQEALTNVTKHSPDAAVTVHVTPCQAGLRVAIRNEPSTASRPASDLPGGRHGLVGLRERAELLGGVCRAEPTEDGGFLVEAVFPHAPTGATGD